VTDHDSMTVKKAMKSRRVWKIVAY